MTVGTILIVDDSRTMRLMLHRELAAAGYSVIEGEDGVDGLTTLEQLPSIPEVIITDINMPRMDGFELIRQIRQLPRFRNIPILVLTTESSAEKKALARKAGATGWIVKPFNSESLLGAIRRITA